MRAQILRTFGDHDGGFDVDHRREIEILRMADRIAAEAGSGRNDDADLTDEQADDIAAVLCYLTGAGGIPRPRQPPDATRPDPGT